MWRHGMPHKAVACSKEHLDLRMHCLAVVDDRITQQEAIIGLVFLESQRHRTLSEVQQV